MASFRSIKNPIVIATCRVVVFWWITLALFDIETYGIEVLAPDELLLRMGFLAGGILSGFLYIAFEVHAFRLAQQKGTEKGNRRGLFSSLGPPPLLKLPPVQAKDVPAKLHYPPDINDRFLDQWFAKFSSTHPSHAALMKALLRVYANDISLPATHIKGGHGGRTLMTHSLLVCGLMLRLAETWGYSGLRGKSGRLVLALRDPGYIFTPDDPMVGIVALAHDIGKIECYIKDAKGTVVDSKYEHDQVGGRMLGRMEEVWSLPDGDRQLLTSVVSFYHRPQELPLANGGLACDDRTIAIMELLIRADATASRLENGQSETEAAQCEQEPPEQEKDSMWGAFCELMMQSGRINGPSASFRLGQKNSSETGTALVYLHETSLRKALAKQMGVDEGPQLGDRSYMLTRSLLKVLQEHGILYQHHNEASFSDSRALFNVEFHNKKGEKLSTWPATIIIDPGLILPTLSNLPDFSSIPTISRATFGAHSAKNKRQDILSAFADGADPESMMSVAAGEPPSSEAAPKKKTRKSPAMAADTPADEISPPLDDTQQQSHETAYESVAEPETPSEAPSEAPTEPARLKDVPSECRSAPLAAQLAYLLDNTAIEHKALSDGRTAIRLDRLPETMEQHILTMTPLPDGIERLSKNDREFLLFRLASCEEKTPSSAFELTSPTDAPEAAPLIVPSDPEKPLIEQLGDLLASGQVEHKVLADGRAAVRLDRLPASLVQRASETSPWPANIERLTKNDREFLVFLAPAREPISEPTHRAVADGQADWVLDVEKEETKTALAETPSDDPGDENEEEVTDDCFDEFSEDCDDEDEGDGGIAIDLPSEDEIGGSAGATTAGGDVEPPSDASSDATAQANDLTTRRAILGAERTLRHVLESGRVKYTPLENGEMLVPLVEAIQFDKRWTVLAKALEDHPGIPSIRYIQKGKKKGLLLAPN